jgi:SAM-dependent methyltransferase
MVSPDRTAYDVVATEYYDPVRHPTCHNFGELSERFLLRRIEVLASREGWTLEIGAGRSVVAPVLRARGIGLDRLILLDRSRAMLEHSRRWQSLGAKLLVADAAATAISDAVISLVVAGLGDPYNDERLWKEVRRVMVPGGTCLFTAPALEWAGRFRASSGRSEAEFVLGDGTAIAVPSKVLSVEKQTRLVATAGMRVVEVADYSSAELVGPHSKKLDVFDGAMHVPIIRGFAIRKS